MKSRTLIVLQNLATMEYVKSLHESGISWCNGWVDAHDFSDMFFIKRWLLRVRLGRELGNLGKLVKLKWKKVIVFEGRGLV